MLRRGAYALAFALPLALAACSAPAPLSRDPTVGAWHLDAPMLHARAAHAVVSDGSVVFALAGTGEGGAPVLAVERFDGRTWSIETMLPGPGLNAPAAVLLRNRIYVIGGFQTDTNVPTARVQVYDLAARAWSEAAPLPAPRGGHAAVVLDGRVHVFGGGNDRTTLADHDVYDPAADRWIAAAPLPRAEGSPAGVAFAGKLFAIGGRSGPADFGDVFIYDPARGAWSTGPSIEPRGTAGAVVHCDGILLAGGESQARRASLDDVLLLDGRMRWQRLAPMPAPRNFARAVPAGDDVLVVGGSPTPEPSHASVGSTTVQRFVRPCASR